MFSDTQHQLRLHRAKTLFVDDNDFLLKRATQDICERLSAIKKTFDKAVFLFGRTPDVVQIARNQPQINNLMRVEEAVHLGRADHIASADNLNLPDEQADLVIAPLTLHWSNDLPGTLIQIRRAMRPDGLLLASLPAPGTLGQLRQALLQAESETSGAGGAANRVDPFTDIRDAGGLLQRAGFALPVVDQDELVVRYKDVAGLIRDLRRFGATHHLKESGNPPLSRAALQRLEEVYSAQFADPDGRLPVQFNTVSLSGWVPHESQQKPLKPGSAQTRLADALKTDEIKLKG